MEDIRNINLVDDQIVDEGLDTVNHVIYQLDDVIQSTGNLELSERLNDIYDSCLSIQHMLQVFESKKTPATPEKHQQSRNSESNIGCGTKTIIKTGDITIKPTN